MKKWLFQLCNAVDFFIFQHTDIMPGARDYFIAISGFGIVGGLFFYSFLMRKRKKGGEK